MVIKHNGGMCRFHSAFCHFACNFQAKESVPRLCTHGTTLLSCQGDRVKEEEGGNMGFKSYRTLATGAAGV